MEKLKLYIAGRITGDPDYKEKFARAQEFYESRGYTVLNPTVLPSGLLPGEYMRICFAMIDVADAVSFLPGYERSPGANLELSYCCYTDKNIYHFDSDLMFHKAVKSAGPDHE